MDSKNSYKNTIEVWDKLAKRYQERFMDLDLYDNTYQFFCENLKMRGSKILEIGCGPGNVTQKLLNIDNSMKILATDVAPNMLKLTKLNNPKVRVEVLDARYIKKNDDNFDGIVAGFVLPYLEKEDCTKFIANCFSKLYKGGLLYISFVSSSKVISTILKGNTEDSMLFSYYPKNFIQELLTSFGFSILNTFEVEYPKDKDEIEVHVIIVAKK